MMMQNIPLLLRATDASDHCPLAVRLAAADEIERLQAVVDAVVEYGKARKDMIALCRNLGVDVSEVDRIAFESACGRQMGAFRRVIQCCDDAANAAEGKL